MNTQQLRIGIIGINGRGRISRFFHNPDGRSVVVGAADLSQKFLDDFKEYGNPDAFTTTDYHELIKRKDIDAILVTTPDWLHEEQVINCLNAGKPVYCEKPMALTVEGCDRMMEASRRNDVKLMIGFNMRYFKFVQAIKEVVDSGEIGEIKAVWIRHFVGMGSRYYYHDWHGVKRYTRSLLLQKGSHDIDVMHYITGKYTKRVAAFGGLDYFGGDKENDLKCPDCPEKDTCPDVSLIHEDKKPDRKYCAFRKEIDIEDNMVCMFELEGGIKATYNECHFTPDYQRNYTFIGTKGRIENNELENKVYVWNRGEGNSTQPDRTIDLAAEEGDRLAETGHGGSDQGIADAFVAMVLDGKEPPVPMEAGRMSVAAGSCAQESLENGGKVVEIPPLSQ